jgi:glyoxylase-like metal-dependent hydrolase (beta-lactamase superfamily II)
MTSRDGFAVVPPHTEFDDALTLPGGIEVRHVGGRHSPDSTVVAVPDSGVLLLGGLLLSAALPPAAAGMTRTTGH